MAPPTREDADVATVDATRSRFGGEVVMGGDAMEIEQAVRARRRAPPLLAGGRRQGRTERGQEGADAPGIDAEVAAPHP